MFAEMVKWAKEEKADFIIGETFIMLEKHSQHLKKLKNLVFHQ